MRILLAIGSAVKLLFVTVEDKTSRQFVRQSSVVIDQRFDMDPRHAGVSQQHPERWLTSARLVFGDPGGRHIRSAQLSQHL